MGERVVAGLLAAVIVPVGTQIAALAQILVLIAVLAGMLVVASLAPRLPAGYDPR